MFLSEPPVSTAIRKASSRSMKRKNQSGAPFLYAFGYNYQNIQTLINNNLVISSFNYKNSK